MTFEKIRQKTQELQTRTRRELLRGWTVPLFLILFFAVNLKHLPDASLRPVFAFAIAWSLAGQYFLHRGMHSAGIPADAAYSAGLESYRQEVQRRSFLIRRVLVWSLGPVLVAVATLALSIVKTAVGGRGMSNAVPFLALVAVWVVCVFIIRMRDRRELEREVDALHAAERANS